MEIRNIKTFIKAAETGNFTKTADELGYSQGTVTLQIKQLEDELGVPLFKMAAEQTGGSFSIESEPGKGTTVTAVFKPSHIDMTPLGDINSTVGLLIYSNPDRDFIFRRERDGRSFALDTRELREILGEEVKLSAPEVSEWIQGYLKEQTDMIFGGAQEDENIS